MRKSGQAMPDQVSLKANTPKTYFMTPLIR